MYRYGVSWEPNNSIDVEGMPNFPMYYLSLEMCPPMVKDSPVQKGGAM
jgi:hypothetical protein